VSTPHLSVVSPVYRAEACLEELCRRVTEAVSPITSDFEIVLVEDGGPDRSWEVIRRLAGQDPHIRGLRLSRNFGQHHAITAGLQAARGEWVIVMDCDLQDRPEEIPRLYAKALEGFDCVFARRLARKDALRKRLTSWVFYKAFNYLTDLHYDGAAANFSILRRQVVHELLRLNEAVRFYGGFVHFVGFRRAAIDVAHDTRFAGQSSYGFLKLWRLSIGFILAYSNKPLRLCVRLGFAMSLVSFGLAAWYLVRALLEGIPVLGWASLIISIFFSTGLIVLSIGVVGLYVDRIFSEVKRRPHFVIQERTFEQEGAP